MSSVDRRRWQDVEAFNGAQSVINYLGRYTHRIAISNRRIEGIDRDNVIYKVKDYKNGGGMVSTSFMETEYRKIRLPTEVCLGYP